MVTRQRRIDDGAIVQRVRRIGVAFPGGDPSSAATWSGTPAGIIEGLRNLDHEPVPLNVGAPDLLRAAVSNVLAVPYVRPSSDLRSSLRRARGTARATPLMSIVDSACTPMHFGERERLDGIIQIGTGVTLRTELPTVTYEDMTVAQNLVHPYEQYALLSRRSMNARMRRQQAAYDQAVACCLATDWAARSVADDYTVPTEKIHVVGVGHRPRDEVAHRDWSVPRFLFVGIDWERKNGPGVLRAFERIQREIPNARLDVVGQHPAIEQPGVRGHGVLRRDVPEERRRVDDLFATSTCYVMPSHLEAAGIVYLEAASSGIPVIGTSVGGASFLIGDGGVTIDPDDDAALVAAMRRFADPDEAAAAGAAGRRRAESFGWTDVADRLARALHGDPPVEWTSGSTSPRPSR